MERADPTTSNPRLQRTRSASPPSPLSRQPLGGVVRLLLVAAVVTGLTGCRQPYRWGTPAFDWEILQLRLAKKCDKAIALLVVANARDDPRWYEYLIDAKLDCLAKKTPQPHYGDEILALVNEGIKRFPRSSRLVFQKAWVNSHLGERGLAIRYYQDALDLAKANIAADKDGRGSEEDRPVAENARANLGAAARPGS